MPAHDGSSVATSQASLGKDGSNAACQNKKKKKNPLQPSSSNHSWQAFCSKSDRGATFRKEKKRETGRLKRCSSAQTSAYPCSMAHNRAWSCALLARPSALQTGLQSTIPESARKLEYPGRGTWSGKGTPQAQRTSSSTPQTPAPSAWKGGTRLLRTALLVASSPPRRPAPTGAWWATARCRAGWCPGRRWSRRSRRNWRRGRRTGWLRRQRSTTAAHGVGRRRRGSACTSHAPFVKVCSRRLGQEDLVLALSRFARKGKEEKNRNNPKKENKNDIDQTKLFVVFVVVSTY